ncbi:hypothetical protein D043_0439B, partial [Vibrio parahaemolyticus EKP-021]
SVINP